MGRFKKNLGDADFVFPADGKIVDGVRLKKQPKTLTQMEDLVKKHRYCRFCFSSSHLDFGWGYFKKYI